MSSSANNKNYVKIGEAAKILGVSIDTLRRWEKAGKISAIRTPGGTRLYPISSLKKTNPHSFSENQSRGLSTEDLLRTTEENKSSFFGIKDIEVEEYVEEYPVQNSTPQAPAIVLTKTSFFSRVLSTKLLIGSAAMAVMTVMLTSWISASYLTQPTETQQFFKNNIASSALSPFHKLAEATVAVIDPQKAQELGFIPPDPVKAPPGILAQKVNSKETVLAVTSASHFLEVNTDTQINGSLFVRDQINNLSLEGTPSASTIIATSGDTTLTVTNDTTLDQNLARAASPSFNTLNLSATSNQLVFQSAPIQSGSGGPTGTLTWTPTAARIITLPDATTTLVGTDTTQTLTNKSLSGSSNTFTNIPNSALTNPSLTISAGTNLTGGGTVALGGSVTIGLKSSPEISGVLLLDNGTAAAPSLAFSSDPDTGLYRVDSNSLGLITGGIATNGITIDANGNVGIGIVSPTSTLHVVGTANVTSNATVGGTFGVTGVTTLSSTLAVTGATTLSSTLNVTGNTTFDTNTLFVDASSNMVGIGNTSPAYSLDVTGNGRFGSSLTIDKNNAALIFTGTTPSITTTNGSLGIFSSTGNVGIGNSTPGATLSVSGNQTIGLDFASSSAPINGLAIQGNLGIGTTTANAKLFVNGGATIGSGFNTVAPTNGLAVQGNVGIGTTSPTTALYVYGRTTVTNNILAENGYSADIGSSSQRFATGYFDTIDATNLSGTVTGGSTSAASWTINSDNATNDAEDMALTFERGTASPNASLTWNSTTAGAAAGYFGLNSGLIMTGTITSTNGLNLGSFTNDIVTPTGEHLSIIPGTGGNVGIGNTSPQALFQINYSNSNPFVVTSGGNVGIGVTSPINKLDVAGAATIGSGYAGVYTAPSNGLLVQGNLGIGATTSSNKLDVWGNARITGNLTVDGSQTFSGSPVFSGQILASDGTAAAPSFSFTNDTDTGLWRNAANLVALTTNGGGSLQSGSTINGLSINSSGNIGIGTTSQGYPLEIATSGTTGLKITRSATGRFATLNAPGGTGNAFNIAVSDGTTTTTSLYMPTTAALLGQVWTGGNLGVGVTAAGSGLQVANNAVIGFGNGAAIAGPDSGLAVSGNVGIGTSNPEWQTQIVTNSASSATQLELLNYNESGTDIKLRLGSSGSASGFSTTNNRAFISAASGSGLDLWAEDATGTIRFFTGGNGTGNQRMVIDSGGNIGIGVSVSPIAKLQIKGTGTTTGLNLVTTDSTNSIFGLSVLDNGNVGIGTTDPTYQLQTTGNVGIGGSLTLSQMILFTKEVDHSIQVLPTTSSNTVGGALTIQPGTGNGNNSGGLLTLRGGTAGSSNNTTNSGGVLIEAGTSSSTSNGANVSIRGAAGGVSGNTTGGAVSLVGGAGAGISPGGAISITGGSSTGGTPTGAGGAVTISTGAGGTTSGSSGVLTLRTGAFTSGSAGAILFQTNGDNTRMTLTGAGNIGIGITNPVGAFQVNGAAGIGYGSIPTSSFPSSGLAVSGNVGIGITTANSTLSVSGNAHIGSVRQGISAPTDGLLVDGNVGIGTTTSSNKLDVWGNARITGTLTVDGALTSNGSITPTGQFLAQDGSASLPGYAFTNDVDSGLWRIGTNQIALTTGGGSHSGLSINSSGNVGIGNTNPSAALEISGNLLFSKEANRTISVDATTTTNTVGGGLSLLSGAGTGEAVGGDISITVGAPGSTASGTTNTGGGITLTAGMGSIIGSGTAGAGGSVTLIGGAGGNSYATGGAGGDVILRGGSRSINSSAADGSVIFQTSVNNVTTERARFNPSGNLGIGTSFPSQIFQVNSGTSATVITSTGNIGIGTTSPTAMLEVYRTGTNDPIAKFGSLGVSDAQSLLLQNGSGQIALVVAGGNSDFITGATTGDSGIRYSSGDDFFIGNNDSAPYFSILSGGNIGIGATTANSKLFVNGGVAIGSGFNSFSAPTDGAFIQGNVGIGATTSSNKLDVWGNARITGTLTVDGSITSNGSITPTGQFLAQDGTASLPGYAFTNDVDSGLWRIGTNQIALTTGGGSHSGLSINSSGNVGIGTTSPGADLHISGTDSRVRIEATGTTNYTATEYVTDSRIWHTGVGGSAVTNGVASKYYIYDSTAARFRLVIDTNGNVGIGTTAPQANLDVNGSSGVSSFLGSSHLGLLVKGSTSTTDYSGIDFSGANNPTQITARIGVLSSGSGSYLRFGTSNSYSTGITNTAMTIDYNGNVGIGITAPTFQLQTTGNVGIGASLNVTSAGVFGSLQVNGISSLSNGVNTTTINSGAINATSLTTTGNITNAGVFLAPDGSATAPAFSFVNDTDSGLWRIGTNQVALTTGASAFSGLSINSSGNVGIGNTSASAAFQVNSGSSSTVITSTGNLGIGITTANSKLVVNGGATIGSGYNAVTAPTDGLLVQGNVGIGTTTTSAPLTVASQSMTSGYLVDINTLSSNTLTTGTMLNIGSAATSLTGTAGTGSLLHLAWAPPTSTTATGDLFALSIGANGSTTGNLFNILDSGSSIFSISESALTTSLPVNFTSPGDVSIAYDINFTNPTASYIKSQAPLYIVAGETFNSTNLTLQTYNSGSILLDTGLNGNVGIGTSGVQNFTFAPTGNLGIGTTLSSPGAKLTVSGGNALIGFSGSQSAPINGLAVSGNVGVGITTANSTLSVSGNAHIGSVRQGISAPTDGLLVDGNVGIGTTTSSNKLDVWGNARITGTLTVDGATTFGSTTSFASTLSLANGSSATPALNFINSTSTGLWSPSANTVALTTSGAATSGLYIDTTGNVGIGTTGPKTKLNVIGNGTYAASFMAGNLGVGTSTPTQLFEVVGTGGSFSYNGTGQSSLILTRNGANQISATNSSGYLNFQTGGTNNRMIIDANGNVGIGSLNPVYAHFMSIGTGTTTAVNLLTTSSAGTPGLAVLDNGNVGIGTTAPTNKFSILGGATIGGAYNVTAPTNGLLVQGNVGIGRTDPETVLHVFGTGAGLIKAERSVSSTNTALSTMATQLTSTGDMSDGFGPVFGFLAKDNAGTTNELGYIGAVRNGADNSGRLIFTTNNSGTLSEKMTITASGNVGIGASTVNSALYINGGATIGGGYNSATAPVNGLIVQGNVGIGTTSATSQFTFRGVDGVTPGGVNFTAGSTNSGGGAGGAISLNGGEGGPSNGKGGAITLTAGPAGGGSSGIGGNIVLTAGASNAVNSGSIGGAVIIGGGDGAGINSISNPGGGVFITGGRAVGGVSSRPGGDVRIVSGASPDSTTGTAGALYLATGNTSSTVGKIVFAQNNILTAAFDTSGNLGIGITNPGAKLTVAGSVGIGVSFASSSTIPANGLAVQGSVGIGTTTVDANAKLTVVNNFGAVPSSAATVITVGSSDGTTGGSSIRALGSITGNLADFGEYFPFIGNREDYEFGDLVVTTLSGGDSVERSTDNYQNNILGIVTRASSFIAGADSETEYDAKGNPTNRLAVALLGRVPLKVSTENGVIKPGDFLTSSSIPGVAMKATRPGQVVGKALEAFDGTTGESCEIGIKCSKVLTFVSASFADPGNFFSSLSMDEEGNLIMPKLKVGKLLVSPELLVQSSGLTTNGTQIVTNEDSGLDSTNPGLASSSDTYDVAGKIATLEDTLKSQELRVKSLEERLAQLEASDSAQIAGVSTESTDSASPSADPDLIGADLASEFDLLDLTDPSILLASDSANLVASLNTYSDPDLIGADATFSGVLTAYKAQVQDSLKVYGNTTLSNTSIAGDLNVDGTLSIETGNTINVVGTLFLQNSALAENLDIFNGKVIIGKDGNIKTVSITADQFKVNENKSAGSGKILSGQTEIVIENPYAEENSIIVLTPNTALSQTLAVINKSKSKFTVKLLLPETLDIAFDYIIIGQQKKLSSN